MILYACMQCAFTHSFLLALATRHRLPHSHGEHAVSSLRYGLANLVRGKKKRANRESRGFENIILAGDSAGGCLRPRNIWALYLL